MHFAPWRSGADLTANAQFLFFVRLLPLRLTVARVPTGDGDRVRVAESCGGGGG
jgi:hypothetical protein